jgi:hypothetical protein
MSVRTKKPPTEAQLELAFVGPVSQADAARRALAALGFVDVSRPWNDGILTGGEGANADALAVPWREVLPPIPEAERPGRMLRAARAKEGLSQIRLATLTGIPQRHLSEMEHGKRTIGKARARQLAAALHIDYHVLL